jgi:hypothetical protein
LATLALRLFSACWPRSRTAFSSQHDIFISKGAPLAPHPLKMKMADRVGFEPTMELPPCQFSRLVPSTTRSPVHCRAFNAKWLKVIFYSRRLAASLLATTSPCAQLSFGRQAVTCPLPRLQHQVVEGYFLFAPVPMQRVHFTCAHASKRRNVI